MGIADSTWSTLAETLEKKWKVEEKEVRKKGFHSNNYMEAMSILFIVEQCCVWFVQDYLWDKFSGDCEFAI